MTPLDTRKYFSDADIAAFVDDVQHGNLAKVSAALKAGQDPNAKGLQGIRPIHFVFAAKTAEVAQALLAAGADANARAPNGHAPLHYAVQQRLPGFAALLLQYKADPNQGGEGGEPVLYVAITGPAADSILPLLVQAGADVNRVWGGYPLLQSAMVQQEWRSAALLLRLGADPALKTKQGETAAATFCRLLPKLKAVAPSKTWVFDVGTRLQAREGPLPCHGLLAGFGG